MYQIFMYFMLYTVYSILRYILCILYYGLKDYYLYVVAWSPTYSCPELDSLCGSSKYHILSTPGWLYW